MNPASDRPGYRQAADKPAVQAQAAGIRAVDMPAADIQAAARPAEQAVAEQVSLEPAEQAGHIAQPEAVLRSSHKILRRWYKLRN